jgi:hypothetical protein
MNDWGPLTFKGHTGNPANLLNDQWYTLDNRRLAAFRAAVGEADWDKIPVKLASEEEIYDERYKFSTPNYGESVPIKGTDITC